MMRGITTFLLMYVLLGSVSLHAAPKIAVFFTNQGSLSEADAERVKVLITNGLRKFGAEFELVPIEEIAFRFDDEYEFPESQFRLKRFIIRLFARLRLDSLLLLQLVKMDSGMILKAKYIHKSEIEKFDYDKSKEYVEVVQGQSLQVEEAYRPILKRILTDKRASGVSLASIDRAAEEVKKPVQKIVEKDSAFGRNLLALYNSRIEPREFTKVEPEEPVVIARSQTLDSQFKADTRNERVEAVRVKGSLWSKSYLPITIVGSILTGSISAYAAFYYMNRSPEYETVTIRGTP